MADDSAGGRRPSPNLIAGLVLVLMALAVLGWQQPWKSDEPPAKPPTVTNAGEAISAQIQDLESARSEEEFVDAAGDSRAAKAWATETYANLELLGATDLRMRYLRGGESGVRDDGRLEATVEVSWKPGADSVLASVPTKLSDVTFVFDAEDNGKVAVHDVERDSGVLPLWLAGKVERVEDEGATVFTIDGGNPNRDTVRETTTAQAAVRKVVPDAKDDLIVISAHTQKQAAALVNQSLESVKQIAAVTTTLDGTGKTAAVIILNPTVFDTMDERAGQIVMSHEATHFMTGATTSSIESWVVEGFADFVALHDDTASLSVSAGQILRSVKADGAPKSLPTAKDFDTTQHGLGGTYESAWMIFRMLGERYSEGEIVGFYTAVLDGTSAAKAVEGAFGLSIAELTRDWRDYLEKSASIGS